MKQRALPEWLQTNSRTKLPKAIVSWQRKDYLGKTLSQLERIMAENFAININRQTGLFKELKPHVKLCGFLTLLIAVAVTRQLFTLVIFNLLLIGAALWEGLGIKAFAIRVWLPVFFFSGLTLLPGTLSWITPGESLYTIYAGLEYHLGCITFPETLHITKQGVKSFLFVTLRSSASLGLGVLLIATTRWTDITKAVASLGLPSFLVAVLDMTYRYLYLFLLLLFEYILGRRSRLIGKEAYAEKLSWIGGTIADFLRLTQEYSQDIHQAMLCRGFTGEYFRVKLAINKKDSYFLLAVLMIFLLVVKMEEI